MIKKWTILLLVFLIVFSGGIALGVYIRNQTLNPRARVPTIFERVFKFFIQQAKKENDDLLYYDTSLARFILNGSDKTKVAVEGEVDNVAPQADGDYHVVVSDVTGLALVTEFIPEIRLPLPKAGDRIKIWGIVRFDVLHNWWELHPVIGWELIK